MNKSGLEKVFYWIVRAGAYALPFTLLMVVHSLFFPFISGKNFAFRIIVEMMAAAWVGLLVIDFKKYWPKRGYIGISLSLFVGIIFVSAIFGPDFKQSFWSNFERMEGLITLLHLLALFFILTGVFRARCEWFAMFGVSIAASVMVAFYGLLEATGEITSFADSSRIISTLGNPLYVAAYLSFHIFLSAFLWKQTKSLLARYFLSGVIVLEGAVFFMTGARGAFVGMLAGIGVIMILSLVTSKSWKKKLIFGGIIGAVLLIPIILYTAKDTSFVKKSDQLSRFANITFDAGEARLNIWGMSLSSFKERPVLGWGIGNFIIPFAKHYNPRMFGQEPWFDRTHNMPLEWLAMGGIFGFLAYLSIFGSMIPSLARGVKRSFIEQKSSFIFIGMFVAYLTQLLFVFDTLATYLTLIFMLGFLHVASFDALLPTDDSQSKNLDAPERQSRKIRREMQRRLDKTANRLSLSFFQVVAIAGVFIVFLTFIVMINVRSIMANQALMSALTYFNQQKFLESRESFQKALRLSRWTIGTEEAREHLTFNVYKLFQNPEILKTPEGEALYQMSLEEMEKQVAENSKKELKIKQNILLAQLYHQWALFKSDQVALMKSFEQYNQVLQFAPNYVSVYPIAANLYAQTGNMNEAIRLIEKAADLLSEADKYDAQIFYSKALFYTAEKRYDEAYDTLNEINLKYGAGGGLDAGLMGNIIKTTSPHGLDAVPFLKKIHQMDESNYLAALMIAQIQAGLDNKEEARFYANEALKRDASLQEKVSTFLQAIDKKGK